MSCQPIAEHPTPARRKELLAVHSINRSLIENAHRKYRTLDTSLKLGLESKNLLSTSLAEPNATKIINVQLDSQLFDAVCKKVKDISNLRRGYFESLDKGKHRYEQKSKDLSVKARGPLKLITKIKCPISEQKTPMKKYITIQRISLPAPTPPRSMKSTSLRPAELICHETSAILKRISQRQIQQPSQQGNHNTASSAHKIKIHKRNYSSIINSRKTVLASTQQLESPKKIVRSKAIEQLQVRRPMGRKDYFVFGMNDRSNPENKVEYFRDFLWKVNYSNALHVQTPEQIPNSYKAYFGPGNNYHLVKGVLKRRFWWTIVDKPDSPASWEQLNFVWTQLKQNHFFALQDKSRTQLEFSQDNQIPQVIDKSPQLTIPQIREIPKIDDHRKLFSFTDLANWNKHLLRNDKTEDKICENTYVRRLNLFHKKNINNIENSGKLKVHNHLESNFFIGNKKALFYNMRKYLQLKGVDPFTLIPLTFHVAKGIEDPDFRVFKKYYEQIQQSKSTNGLKNIWIVKPGQNTNRGNGISVAYSIDDILVRIKGRQKNSDGKLRTFIIQKYIQRPLLYFKRKFDIRHYMLVTCINGNFKGYWYEEGYIRTSSSQFTTKYSKDLYVHLTNDAIQKNGANYGKFEKGNKLSYQQFQKYLQSNHRKDKVSFFDDILPKMKAYATEAVRATYALLDQKRSEHNFELLGLDFMIDQDFNPWLIEANTNPCLELSCSLLQKIIPQLIDNVFKLCVDPLFPPPECWQSSKKMYFGEYPLAENKFEIIFDEYDDGKEVEKLYKGGPKLDQKMGKIEEDDEVFEDDGVEDWQNKK